MPSLITTGPYRYTRNPMYVAVVTMQVGIGVAFGILWILVAIPVAILAITYLVIRREEEHLEAKFGEDYRSYARRVRRWI